MDSRGFLEQGLIFLVAALVAVPLFKRLGLGSVLGYLVAGMAIGPWGLRLIGDPQTVLHVAEFGVVLLLFLVGLELNAQRVWSMRRAIFGLGSVQVALTLGAVAILGVGFGLPWPAALVAGMGLAMSSTAIGLATLAERNLLPTPGGQASFAVLLFQDLAVVPMLIALSVFTGEKSAFSLATLGKAVAMVVVLVVAGRFLVRPVLRYIAETRMREIFVGFALLVALGTAALMDAVGLSMALGAFLAGVMLADSEYRHELELDIEPFKGLLLGLFFIAVGMSIDFGMVLRSPLLVLGLAAGLVALKAAILFPIARLFGYCKGADAALFTVALAQGGEFAFVLFTAAAGLVAPETLALLNAVVAGSMLATPFLFIAYQRWLARRGAKAAPRAADEIRESNPVLVAGFGRFGQVAVRVLRGLGIGATVIDQDPGQIDTVRRFGFKAYYGDATRLDLLESAGADRAKVLLLAIDDPDAALAAVKRIRKRFPALEIVVRARARTDAFEYAEMGVPAVREVFGSALDATQMVLRKLDYPAETARRVVDRFREYDEEQLRRSAEHRHDVAKLIALSEQGRRDIAQLLASEASAANVDQRDARADQDGGERKDAA